MYPFARLAGEFWRFRKAPMLAEDEVHVSRHRCWPWDLDIWMELNNGRTLTLLDLGRILLSHRIGLARSMRARGWLLAMAGASVRWRRRVRMFDRFEMRSRCIGWDERFLYIEQGMWVRGECANHALYRAAVTDARGIVPTAEVRAAMGLAGTGAKPPAWARAWIEAEAQRPWPPAIEP